MDLATRNVLRWINVRRSYLNRPDLDDLLAAPLNTDPISYSLGASWVLGSLQVKTTTRVMQYDVPDHVRTWLAQWRAGRYPTYSEDSL